MDSIGNPYLLSVGGVPLHWVERGQGQPLVLLHGLTDSHRTWRKVAERLAARRRVLMLDLPGHGLSGRPDASYELDWHARAVASWLDALGLEDVDLVGHSFGAGVAQQLLLHRGGAIRRLGLVSAGGLGREVPVGLRLLSMPWLEPLIQPFMGIGTRLALAGEFARVFDPRDKSFLAWANAAPGTGRAVSRTVRGVIGPWGQTRGFLDRVHEVQELPPIELYWGTNDPVIPQRHGMRAASYLRHVRLVRFAGCGHFPHLEQPAAFSEELSRFLDLEQRRARVAVPPALPRRPSWFRRALRWMSHAVRRLLAPTGPSTANAR